jgi:4-hydroxy-2-oxoglutarate aldolase
MYRIDLNGIFPPITTPFIDGEIAYDPLSTNVMKWGETGIKGFVVLGSNGEYVYLSEAEKRKVVETVVQSAPKNKLVIAGTGCESTIETLRLTEDFAKLGVNAALIVTPHYYAGGMRQNVLFNHYKYIADRSPIPIILYSVPKFTHINIAADTVSRLSEHPNIIGIKESSGNLNLLGEFINQSDRDFSVLNGTAGSLFGALAIGCRGAVIALANIAPDRCVELFQMVQEKAFKRAREIQLQMIPVNNAITTTYGIGGMKAAMDMLGYFGGDPRLPLRPPSAEQKSAIEQILRKAKLLN